jgi:AraC family transcriptional regulator
MRSYDNPQRAATLLLEAARLALQGQPDAVQRRTEDAVELLRKFPAQLNLPSSEYRPAFSELPHTSDVTTTRLLIHIECNLSASLRVVELARIVGLSGRNFHSWFRRKFGSPPHAYIRLRRVELAKSLLLSTSMPLSEIALQCGMSDQPHLTRAFRIAVGDTPARWRAAWARDTWSMPADCAPRVEECTVPKPCVSVLNNRS